MRAIILFIFFITSGAVFGQKLVKKKLINPESKTIQIDANRCFAVSLSTSQSQEISVAATIDGEYQKDLLVTLEEEGTNVWIGVDFRPDFQNPNDKLSAHKVLSISLEIRVPEYLDTQLYGTSAAVSVHGQFKRLKVDLADGSCTMNNVGEEVQVRTQSGDIVLKTKAGTVDAQSDYGDVNGFPIQTGNNNYSLHTVEGDIHISKTK